MAQENDCRGTNKGNGCVLGCLSGFQYGEVRQGNFGWNSVGGWCFSENYIRGHECFKVIVDVVYGVFFVDN